MTQSLCFLKMNLIFILPFLGALVALPQNQPHFVGGSGPYAIINITDLDFDNSSESSLPTTTVKPDDETGVKLCNNVVQDNGKRTLTLVTSDDSFHRNTLTLEPNPETGFYNITSMTGIFTFIDPITGKTTALQYTADERGFIVSPYTKRIPSAALASLAGGGLG